MAQSSPDQSIVPPEDGIEILSRCPYCGSDDFNIVAENVRDFFFKCDNGAFNYLECKGCGSLWLRNRPCGDRLLQAYSSYYTHAEASVSKVASSGLKSVIKSAYIRHRYGASGTISDRLICTAISASGYDTTGIDEQYRFAPKAPAKLLDYGCGSGSYLLRLHALGYDLSGAEYDPQLIGGLADRGIRIADVASLEDDHWQNEFDHITLAHVVEHVPDPNALLRRLHGWLKPGGTLYLEVPNAQSTGFEIFGRYWRGLEAPRHFALPGRAALAQALGKAGFGTLTQHINRNTRGWVWAESMDASPLEERQQLAVPIASAAAENYDNAEFLTFLAQKPPA